jgi:hypothetical protein
MDVAIQVTECTNLIVADSGGKEDTFAIMRPKLNENGSFSSQSVTFSIKSKNRKKAFQGPGSNVKTGENIDNFRSTDDSAFKDHVSGWWSSNKSNIMNNMSTENLVHNQHMKSAEQRFWMTYVHTILEHYRAFVGSLPEDEQKKCRENPPIIVWGNSYKGGWARKKFLAQFFTVVAVDEYMTSQTCPSCLKKNTQVPGNLRLRDCVHGCKFKEKDGVDPGILRVNKDVAACFNLQAIFLQMIANGSRRAEFKKSQ